MCKYLVLLVAVCTGCEGIAGATADYEKAKATAAIAIEYAVMAPLVVPMGPVQQATITPAPQPPIVLPKIEHPVRCLQCRKTGTWKLPFGESAAVGVACPACGGTMYPYQRY